MFSTLSPAFPGCPCLAFGVDPPADESLPFCPASLPRQNGRGLQAETARNRFWTKDYLDRPSRFQTKPFRGCVKGLTVSVPVEPR